MQNIFDKAVEKACEELADVKIEALIRDIGLLLDKEANLESGILGQIERLDDGRYKISIKKDDHYFRQRFTMAHELGHYILHRDLIGGIITDDQMYRNTSSSVKIDLDKERQANRFAANILIPKELIIKISENIGYTLEQLKKLDKKMQEEAIKTISKKMKVSPKALRITIGISES